MRWFFSNETAVCAVFCIAMLLMFVIGDAIEQHQHNSCVVEMAKAGKTVEEAKGVCK